MISSAPDLLRFSLFDRAAINTRTDLTIAAQEVVTGRKFDLTKSLGIEAGEYNIVTKTLADIETFDTRLALGDNRLRQVEVTLQAVRGGISGIAEDAEASLALPGAVTALELKENAAEQIKGVLSSLNANHAGRRLFSGDATDQLAVASGEALLADIEALLGGATDRATVDATITAYFADGGGFDTNIYTGGTGDAAPVRLPDGQELRFDTRANDPAFKDILEGLARIAFVPDDVTTAYVHGAATKLRNGDARLIGINAEIGRQQSMIDRARETGDAQRTILSASEDELAGVDPFEAANRMQRLEVQLEAAFTVASRLTRLNFSNFVR